MFKQIVANPYNWFLGFLTILVTLPILAPLMLYIGLEQPAKGIYFIYSFMCHQFDHRSLHLYDYQYAWCARDTAIWLGVWIVAWYTKFSDIKPIKLYWLIPFVIPIAMDGGIQTIYTILDIEPTGVNAGDPLYISNNFTRFMTGGIFGIGLSMWISPTFKQVTERASKFSLNLPKYAVAITLIPAMILVYIGGVGAWSVTSSQTKPQGTLDMIVRTPSVDFYARRKNAVCPTSGVVESDYTEPSDNLLQLDCFF